PGDQLSCGPVECASLVINGRPYGLSRLAIEAIPNLLDGPRPVLFIIEGAVDHSTSNPTKFWQILACGLELHHGSLPHQLLLADADACYLIALFPRALVTNPKLLDAAGRLRASNGRVSLTDERG